MDKKFHNGSSKDWENDAERSIDTDHNSMNHPLHNAIQENRLKVEIKQTEGFQRNAFVSQQNIHLSNSIRFADAKAGALVTVNGLVVSYVINLIASSGSFSSWLYKISLLFLVFSILYSISVVYPRFINKKEKGLVYWGHINNYTKDEYVDEVLHGDTDLLIRSSIESNYNQAIILTKKFKRLSLGFKIAIGGYILVFSGLLLELLFK